MEIFAPALSRLNQFGYYGPESFQSYVKNLEFGTQDTPRNISIDSKQKLATELRDANTMVLRMGYSSDNKSIQFILAQSNNINDFFIIDEQIQDSDSETFYSPLATERELFVYRLLPVLTESSLVNLGLVNYSGKSGHI